MSDLEKADELAGLVESFLLKLDEEMEHGDYHASDTVPSAYEDEAPYYYERHEAIIEDVRARRAAVERCIREIRGFSS